jgi:hypothetical protein
VKSGNFMRLLVVLAGFATLATPRGHAQSDMAPDQFDSPNTEPFPQPKTPRASAAVTGKVRFDGQVNLPYSVRCAGKMLPPGNYSLSVSSDGKTGRATLKQKGQTFDMPGAVRLPADSLARNTLLVECIGKAHRLSAIRAKEIELVFDSDAHVDHTSDGKPNRIEKLLFIRTSPQK